MKLTGVPSALKLCITFTPLCCLYQLHNICSASNYFLKCGPEGIFLKLWFFLQTTANIDKVLVFVLCVLNTYLYLTFWLKNNSTFSQHTFLNGACRNGSIILFNKCRVDFLLVRSVACYCETVLIGHFLLLNNAIWSLFKALCSSVCHVIFMHLRYDEFSVSESSACLQIVFCFCWLLVKLVFLKPLEMYTRSFSAAVSWNVGCEKFTALLPSCSQWYSMSSMRTACYFVWLLMWLKWREGGSALPAL